MTKKLSIHGLLCAAGAKSMFLGQELRRYGHTLGLAVEIELGSSKLQSEGNAHFASLTILSELLDQYVVENGNNEIMAKVADIFRLQKQLDASIINFLKALSELEFLNSKDNLALFCKSVTFKNKLLSCQGIRFIPSVSHKDNHAMYIIYNEKYVAVSNRGYTEDFGKFGIMIYELKPEGLETLDNLNRKHFNTKTIAEIEAVIATVITGGVKVKLDFKPQKIGTCSFANLKSLIKPTLYLLGEDEDYVSEYKKFTTWLREHEIRGLVGKYLQAIQDNDSDAIVVYKSLLSAYIKKQRLNKSLLARGAEKIAHKALDVALWFISRSDIKHSPNQESIDRRHNNVVFLYANMKDAPEFTSDFQDIVPKLEELLDDPNIASRHKQRIDVHSNEEESVGYSLKEIVQFTAKLVAVAIILIMAPIVLLLPFIGCLFYYSYLRQAEKVSNNATYAAKILQPATTSENDTTESPFYPSRIASYITPYFGMHTVRARTEPMQPETKVASRLGDRHERLTPFIA